MDPKQLHREAQLLFVEGKEKESIHLLEAYNYSFKTI